ncbi:hypothetical protein [Streptomyces radiopugnans]|uniref:hypothetical protein n=1 Tax=Streptomyces radiopugnans TaxID=403935 RepID=UPI003F1B85B4
MGHDMEGTGNGSGFQDGVGELQDKAHELYNVVGRFDGIADMLRRTLPRVAQPRNDAEFRAAVEELVNGLDEEAIHHLNMLVSELWFYREVLASPGTGPTPGVHHPSHTPGLGPAPSLQEALADRDRSSWFQPGALQSVVDIAGYLATAAVGGIVGNKSDLVVSKLIEAARSRWHARRSSEDASLENASLSRDEAIDVARAAAHIQGFAAETVSVLTAEQQDNGSWTVRLRASSETLRVTVPAGDPAQARILFEAL